jgi:hypothetical protein
MQKIANVVKHDLAKRLQSSKPKMKKPTPSTHRQMSAYELKWRLARDALEASI